MRLSIRYIFAVVALIMLAPGCRPRTVVDAVPAHEQMLPTDAGPDAEDYPHLHNLLHATDQIYSGGEPHGEEAFAELARLGVKTVVSVDGARPQVEAANAHGLTYVHIPIGYDGVSNEAGKSLARLAAEGDGPFYIHCHHGKHRGPAAAAIACVAAGATDGEGALAILERAGTSKDYAGLWRDVKNYQPPRPGEDLPELVSVAEVGSLATAMAQIDRAKDNLALCKDADWSAVSDHPDLVAAQEALILREALHETGRHLTDDYDQGFGVRLGEAETIAKELQQAIEDQRYEAASGHFERMLKSCKECHVKYRD